MPPRILFVAAAGLFFIVATRAQSAPIKPAIQTDIPSLHEVLAEYFPVGAAITLDDTSGPHSELLRKHFNSITAENAMKWASIEPTEGHIDFSTADALVKFAEANHMRVRGHCLVWHRQFPNWVFRDEQGNPLQPGAKSKALVLSRLEKHIRDEVGHYKGKIYAWDVVNEVIDPKESDGFRRSPWFELTGTDYITTAFRVAHEVDPGAKLYVNDYDTTDAQKRTFLYNLVRSLRSKGVPIDGVGHQMHSNIATPPATAILQTINMFSQLGVDNQITELDMSLYTDFKTVRAEFPESLLIEQGYRYRDFFQVFRQLKGKISSVTFWGIADDHTWLKSFFIKRRDLPLLFDEHLQAKYAYWGVVDPAKLPKRQGEYGPLK